MRKRMWLTVMALGALVVVSAGPAQAVPCGGNFSTFIDNFKVKAAAHGLSQRTLSTALAGVRHDARVVKLDRDQRVFKQTFEEFSSNRIAQRMKRAQALLRQHAQLFARIEQQFGVPGPVILAIWGLETDFGANTGNRPALPALATLAHDCRRTEMFQTELMAALKLIERGDLSAEGMRGAWAGELGQTQFLPSNYVKFAVDFDGDGRADLIRSVPDALASTANYLRGHGWRHGEPWTEGTHNFEVIRKWNLSQVYAKTIALFATQLSATR